MVYEDYNIGQEIREEIDKETSSSGNVGNLDFDDIELEQVPSLVSKSLRIGGATDKETAASLLLISEVLSRGVLRSEEFRALSENGVGLMQAIADGACVTPARLRELSLQGEVTVSFIVKALTNAAPQIEAQFNKLIDSSGNVGNLDSDDIGTGARFNEGKPDYSLMILEDMPLPDNMDKHLWESFDKVASFQVTGDPEQLKVALHTMYHYALSKKSEKEFTWEEVVRVWEFGQKKYKRWNWVKGMPWSVPLGCYVRHLLMIVEKGQEIDQDSGQPHWAAMVCNLQMLSLYTRIYPEGNDLPYLVWEK